MKKLKLQNILQFSNSKIKIEYSVDDDSDDLANNWETYSRNINNANYIELLEQNITLPENSYLTSNIFFLTNKKNNKTFNSVYLYDIVQDENGISVTNIRPLLIPGIQNSGGSNKISYSAIAPIAFNIFLNKMANYLDSLVNKDFQENS